MKVELNSLSIHNNNNKAAAAAAMIIIINLTKTTETNRLFIKNVLI